MTEAELHQGDALTVLRTLPAGSVRCCVTSPPYFALRDYGIAGQIGLEATPEAYVARLVEVFREVRRVLADDGTLWLNLGSSYCYGNQQGRSRDTSDKGLSGCRDGDSFFRRPDDEHRASELTRTEHNESYPVPLSAVCATDQNQGRTETAFSSPDSSGSTHQQPTEQSGRAKPGQAKRRRRDPVLLPDVLHPMPLESSFSSKPNASILSREAISPSGQRSSADDVQDYVDRTACTVGTAAPSGASIDHKSDTASSSAACGDPHCKGRCGICWAYYTIPSLRFKAKDLLPIPWLVAMALQADGWYLRSDIPWVKRSAMPSSVTDRPSSALEYVFLLSKESSYYFDQEAVRKQMADSSASRYHYAFGGAKSEALVEADKNGMGVRTRVVGDRTANAGRNLRNTDLWFESLTEPWGAVGIGDEWVGLDITSRAYPEAHFATFPEALPAVCIKAGTSQKGKCPHCGAAWVREVERGNPSKYAAGEDLSNGAFDDRTCNPQSSKSLHRQKGGVYSTAKVLGWSPSCTCPPAEPIPDVVLDPFTGTATTGVAALKLGRHFVGIELSPQYLELARKRLAAPLCVGSLFDPDALEAS